MTLAIPDGRFSAYIFDCDGTLADTMPLHYRAWRRLLQEYGAPFPEDLFYQMGGKPTERILEQLRDEYGLRVLDVQQAARRKEEFFLEMIHEVKPIADVVEIALRAHAIIPMAVASGGLRKYVEITLDAIGIRGLFDAIVCVEDYVRGKPFPDPFLEAARRLNQPAHACLVFEDSPLGIQAADAAGMQSVLVPRAPPLEHIAAVSTYTRRS
ncbi:MAG: HAD family phosphatase [Steroidobacteraceae bacterium]|jgi:HAD superfamily hydrolase (TIGR01509 family)